MNVRIAIAAVGSLSLAACGPTTPDSSSSTSASPASPSSSPPAGAAAQTSPSSAWIYSEIKAPLQDKPAKLACVESNEDVRLNPPYQNQRVKLCLRSGPGFSAGALITLEDQGQFVCGYEECTVSARFDGGRIQRFSGNDRGQDGRDDVMYISSAPRLAAALKRSKIATFALQFYEAGTQEISFNVSGLNWGGAAPRRLYRR